MTSAVGGGRGSPKSRQKEWGCVNSVRDKVGGSQKIPKIWGRHISIANKLTYPEAQFPDDLPFLSSHSSTVMQVPLRYVVEALENAILISPPIFWRFMAHSAKYLQERVSLIMRHPIHPSISGILSSYFPSIEPLYQKPFVNYACCLAISLLKLCCPSSVRGKTFEVRQRSSIFHMVYSLRT